MHEISGNPHERLQVASTDEDLLPVVDEHDRLMRLAPRREVHLNQWRHRAVHVCVFDPSGRLWLQLRSRAKDAWGGYWDLSATGHVDPGESYEEAARRELSEELGLDVDPKFITKLEATAVRCWEFHALYSARWAGEINAFNQDEIERVARFTRAQLDGALAQPGENGEATLEGFPLCPGIADALPHLAGFRP